VEPDALDATDANGREAEGVLQDAKLAFHGGAAAVQILNRFGN
jgi:hypothetical protein